MSRAAALMALAAALLPLPAAAQTLAIVNAEAWTMQGSGPIDDATIVIADGRVQSIAAGGAAPVDAAVIDAHGAPVTPGLFNAATQIGLIEVSSALDTRDVAATGDTFGAAFDVSYALNGNSVLVGLARADGITRALSFPSRSGVAPFSGQAALIRLRNGADILDRARAAMFVVIGGGAWPHKAGSRAAQWGLLRAALDEARAPPADPRARLLSRADAKALAPVLARTVPLAIETNRESDIRQAIRLADDYGVKIVIVGGAEAWRAADALAAAHIPVVLDPGADLPISFDQLGARLDNAAILAKAGVKIAFGLVGGVIELSYNAGLDLREDAGLAVANGLPYEEALKALTVNAATIWGVPRASATIAPGAAADLVVWDGDPLEPMSGAVAVIVEGERVALDTHQRALEQRYLPLATAYDPREPAQ